MESIALKRAAVVDADKVRYRVYRAPDDYVAVIAESALLAMRASGIDTPYRIVRDLPTEGIAIEAKRLQQQHEAPRIVMPTALREKAEGLKVEMPAPVTAEAVKSADFVPMQVKDFQKKKQAPWARILTSNMVEPIEGTAGMLKVKKNEAPIAVPEPMPVPATVMPPPPAEPLAEAPPPAPVEAAPQPAPAPEPAQEGPLSEDEVQQLLNG